jgi:hypothetical protein
VLAALAVAFVLVHASPSRAEEAALDASEAVAVDDEFSDSASEPIPWYDMAFDATVLRPLGAVQFAVGSIMLIPAWPLSWPGGGDKDVMELLFWAPFDYTFTRPLGEL